MDEESQQSSSSIPSSRLGFLRRHQNTASERTLSRSNSTTLSSSGTLKVDDPPEIIIPGLDNLPVLKRVSFDIPVFFNDPPQQIPSRTPRKGEVEILKDGSIVIHKLTMAEKRQLMTQGGGGIVVGGTGHLKMTVLPKDETKQDDDEPPSPTQAINGDSRAAQQHSIEVAAAEAAAEARGKAGPNELMRTQTNNEDEVIVSKDASKINIDKPMVRHNKSSASLATMATLSDDDSILPPSDVKVPLDILYTRCCHLREILPIPATMKQIKSGTTDPIPLLQLRNPKPSLVEVLTFSDFISIAPVLCVSLDGVSLSSEMFRIILSSLVAKKELEKLTLRNTPIDELGWRLLCWFLTKNATMSRIDLTQVPTLHTNVQKPCKTATASTIVRMECDMTSRTDMNWNLFNAALVSRNGIEELVINGAKMSDDEFDNLIEMGASLTTQRLGLAYNDLSKRQVKTLATKMNVENIIGLDLGYNDLSDKIHSLVTDIPDRRLRTASFKFLSLNSCNLNNDDGIVDRLISNSVGLRDLRYIDLSNNKRLFPSIMMCLTECLPVYPKLARIHLEYNDLSQNTIVAFAELIPFCKSLSYISFLGNKLDYVSSSALTNAMKISTSVITLDLDYDQVPSKFRHAISLYTVRNMQNQISNKEGGTENFNNLQSELSSLLASADDDKLDKDLIGSFLKKTLKVRESIHESIEDLFRLRIQGQLNTEGKEALIRFCYIDNSIEKGLNLLRKRAPIRRALEKLEGSVQCQSDITQSADSIPMARGSSANISLSEYMNANGRTELMPFGVVRNEAEHTETQEIKDDDIAHVQDNSKLKEEGSVLKLGELFRSSVLSEGIDSERLKKLEDMSGDKVREAILEASDAGNLVDVLEKMKGKGVRISEIYKKSSYDVPASELLDLETFKNTKSNVPQRHTIVNSDSDSDSEAEKSNEEEEHVLNQAYDEILDRLERVRTNN
jgi:hypothetical protein